VNRLLVPELAQPRRGHQSTTFTVTWAAQPLPGYVFEIQIRCPGSTFLPAAAEGTVVDLDDLRSGRWRGPVRISIRPSASRNGRRHPAGPPPATITVR